MAYIRQIRKLDPTTSFKESWESFSPGDTMQLNLKGLTAIYNNAVVTFSSKKGSPNQPINTANVLPVFVNTGNLTQQLPADVTAGEVILSLIPTQTANFERLSTYVLELQFLLANATVESWQIVIRTGQDIVANVIPATPAVSNMVFLGNFAVAPLITTNGNLYYNTVFLSYFIYNGGWQALGGGGGGGVVAVFGRTGIVTAVSGDYNTSQVPENTNLYHTAARVLATVLAGLSTASSAVITASSTALEALGQLQAQITTNIASLASKTDKLITQITKTGSHTLETTDANLLIEMNVATANNLTIPLNATVAFPNGTQIIIWQEGIGQTTIVPTVGVTIKGSLVGRKLANQYAAATLIKESTNTWKLIGNIVV